MPRINNLLSALTQIIVAYCGPLSTEITESEEQDADYIAIPSRLPPVHEETISQLNKYIEQAKEKRRPLLNYLLHMIKQLKSFIDTDVPTDQATPLTPELQEQLVQFIIVLQQLLNTSQSTSIQVHYDSQNIQIDGLQMGLWELYKLCKSGQMIQDTFFSILMLSVQTSHEDITKIIVTLFKEHQCDAIEKDNQRLQSAIKLLKEQVTSATFTLWQARAKLDSSNAANQTAQFGQFFEHNHPINPGKRLDNDDIDKQITLENTVPSDDELLQTLLEDNRRFHLGITRLNQKILAHTTEINDIEKRVHQPQHGKEAADASPTGPSSIRQIHEHESNHQAVFAQRFGEYTFEKILASTWTLLKSVANTMESADDVRADTSENMFDYY